MWWSCRDFNCADYHFDAHGDHHISLNFESTFWLWAPIPMMKPPVLAASVLHSSCSVCKFCFMVRDLILIGGGRVCCLRGESSMWVVGVILLRKFYPIGINSFNQSTVSRVWYTKFLLLLYLAGWARVGTHVLRHILWHVGTYTWKGSDVYFLYILKIKFH